MIVDPAASLRCWEIDVELGGQTYTIPALPAASWWGVVTADDPVFAVIELLPGNADDLDDRLDRGEISLADLSAASVDAIEAASGRSLLATLILAHLAASLWPKMSGRLILAGFRWDVMPLGAALDAIYALAMEYSDDEHRKELQALLDEGDPAEVKAERAEKAFAEGAGPKPATGLRVPVLASGEPSGGTRPKTRISPKSRHQPDRIVSPTVPPAVRADSDQVARNASRQAAAARASGIGTRPPRRVTRSPQLPRSAELGPGSVPLV